MFKRKTIEEMQALARKWGGECLSGKYVDSRTGLRWRCAQGHEWVSAFNCVGRGHWCPECGRRKKAASRRRHTIDDMCAIAKKRGGECLSPEFQSIQKHLLWRCAEGHEWKALPAHVIRGGWCRTCYVLGVEKKG